MPINVQQAMGIYGAVAGRGNPAFAPAAIPPPVSPLSSCNQWSVPTMVSGVSGASAFPSPPPLLTKKLGRFFLDRWLINDRPEQLFGLFVQMIILEASPRWEFDRVEYLAMSERFTVLTYGSPAPYYEVLPIMDTLSPEQTIMAWDIRLLTPASPQIHSVATCKGVSG